MRTRTIAPGDVAYPAAMSLVGAVSGNPPPLYLRGQLPSQPGIAVVGTRKPSEEASEWTRKHVRTIATRGLSIWSGGALGIDGLAHESALAAGAPTVLVTAGGLDDPYPKKHAGLHEQILASGGALMSLQPDGGPRWTCHFLQRNHVLAALSMATLMVEGTRKSGTRHTVSVAWRLGRMVLVVPGSPWSKLGEGAALELAAGGAVAVTSATQVLEALNRGAHTGQTTLDAFWRPAPPRSPVEPGVGAGLRRQSPRSAEEPPAGTSSPNAALDPTQQRVLAQLSRQPEHIDLICERTALAYPVVSCALLTMSLMAVVVEGPEGHYRRL